MTQKSSLDTQMYICIQDPKDTSKNKMSRCGPEWSTSWQRTVTVYFQRVIISLACFTRQEKIIIWACKMILQHPSQKNFYQSWRLIFSFVKISNPSHFWYCHIHFSTAAKFVRYKNCSLTPGISFLFADDKPVSVFLHVSSTSEGEE